MINSFSLSGKIYYFKLAETRVTSLNIFYESHTHVLKPEAMGSDLARSCPLKFQLVFTFFNYGCSS